MRIRNGSTECINHIYQMDSTNNTLVDAIAAALLQSEYLKFYYSFTIKNSRVKVLLEYGNTYNTYSNFIV